MVKIVGKQNVDYVSKKTNQQVTGITLHVIGPDSRVDGMAVETVFISSRMTDFAAVQKLNVGDEVEFLYNRWGNVESVRCKK